MLMDDYEIRHDFGIDTVFVVDSQKALKEVLIKDSGEVCGICFEEIKVGDDDDDVRSTECCHLFHLRCILQWIKRKPNCPICRHIRNLFEKYGVDSLHLLCLPLVYSTSFSICLLKNSELIDLKQNCNGFCYRVVKAPSLSSCFIFYLPHHYENSTTPSLNLYRVYSPTILHLQGSLNEPSRQKDEDKPQEEEK